MKYYFHVQYLRLNRWLNDIGLHPIVAVVLAAVAFIALSTLLFHKTEYASWLYLLFACSQLLRLNDKSRVDFMRSIFDKVRYFKIRLIENSLVALPFLVYLLYERQVLPTLFLALIALVFAYKGRIGWSGRSIPTPFYNHPFEFIVGFRKMLWLIIFLYFILFKAIQVNNYNLGLACFAGLLLICLFFYQKPESSYFVWVYKEDATGFILKKLKSLFYSLSIYAFLPLSILFIAFPNDWKSTVVLFLIGCLYVGSMVIAKYAAFPREMNVPQTLLYVLSFIFPPFLPFVLIHFYSKAKAQLNRILS